MPPEIILPAAEDEYGRKEPPIDPLDDIVSHACALSEAEVVVLILDQLQVADFREHIRIHRLVRDPAGRHRHRADRDRRRLSTHGRRCRRRPPLYCMCAPAIG
jgi:hypothetical protein